MRLWENLYNIRDKDGNFMLSKLFNTKKINVITPLDYQNIVKTNKPHVLLDVRRTEEFDEKHIVGASLLSLHNIERDIERLYPNKDATYILYCRSGIRSQDALKLMMHLGYKHVYDLGGIIDYPYEVIK